jgi:hypothetical protein
MIVLISIAAGVSLLLILALCMAAKDDSPDDY